MLSAGASPSTSSPTGNYGLTKIAVAQVSVLLSTLKTQKDDPVEYENRLERLKKVRFPLPWGLICILMTTVHLLISLDHAPVTMHPARLHPSRPLLVRP